MFSSNLNFSGSLDDLECQFFDFFGKKVAYFEVNGKRMVCLLQIYELFLKQLVGGLHTVYNKLKRLNIVCSVCTIEQVRALRLVGAIQSGVNRCKLIEMADLEKLIEDCSDLRPRPGRPPRRTIGGLMSSKQESPLTDIVPVIGLATTNQLPRNTRSTDTIPNPLQFLTNFLPITQSVITPDILASVMQFPALSSVCSSDHQENIESAASNDSSSNENSDEKNEPDFGRTTVGKTIHLESLRLATTPKPTIHLIGKNTDQDSGSNSGPSSSQGDSPNSNSQSMQFVLNKLVCLIENTESTFKTHCQRLAELSCELHKQINEIVHRERSTQFALHFQRQKAAHYQRRYIARKLAPYRHKKRHKTSASMRNHEYNGPS